MVSESPNGAGNEPTKDVELSNSDKNQQEEHDSLDKAHKEEKKLPDFFPSHGLTTAGKQQLQGPQNAQGHRKRVGHLTFLVLLWVVVSWHAFYTQLLKFSL